MYIFFFQLLLSIALLLYLFQTVGFDILLIEIAKFDFWAVGLCLVLLSAQCVFSALRWIVIVSYCEPAKKVVFVYFVRCWFKSGVVGLLLPAAIGGDILRVLFLRKVGISVTRASIYVLIDRGMGLSSIIIYCFSAVIYLEFFFDSWSADYFLWLSLLAIIFLNFCLLGSILLISYFFLKKYDIRTLVALVVMNGSLPLLSIISVFGFILSSGHYNLLEALVSAWVAAPLMEFISSMPISLGGWGLREYSLTYVLPNFEIGDSLAVAIGVVFGIVYMFSLILGFFISGYFRGSSEWLRVF